MHIDWNDIQWSTTRSRGPGGQHVNKTNSCVVLEFSISQSQSLSLEQKEKLLSRLKNQLVQGDIIQIRSEEQRDQKSNKDMAFKKLIDILKKTLFEPKKRKATKPSRSSVHKRLNSKKRDSEIKKLRSEKIKA